MKRSTADRAVLGGLSCMVRGDLDQCGVVPLLLVHGAAGSAEHWRWFSDRLPADMPSIAVDLPGHGHSGGTVPRSVDAAADHLVPVLETLTADGPAGIVAHSLGGLIALRLSMQRPDLVSHLTLIATAAKVRAHPELMRQVATREPDAEFLRPAFSAGIPMERFETVVDDIRRVRVADDGDLFGAGDADLSADLTEIVASTLVIVASGDRVVSPRRSRALAAAVTDARLVVMTGGHYLHIERPTDICAMVTHFMRNIPAAVRTHAELRSV